jgi:hypothetical protein
MRFRACVWNLDDEENFVNGCVIRKMAEETKTVPVSLAFQDFIGRATNFSILILQTKIGDQAELHCELQLDNHYIACLKECGIFNRLRPVVQTFGKDLGGKQMVQGIAQIALVLEPRYRGTWMEKIDEVDK